MTAPTPTAHVHARVLAEQRSLITQTLSTLVSPREPVALVNFPNHRNVGDTAIWLGAEAVLAQLGVPVRYRAAWDACSVRALRRRIGDGPILLNGGGNLGDLYRGQQSLRERLLAVCVDNPIVQLPQSIHFTSTERAAHMAGLVARHGQVTVLCREHTSLQLGTELFGERSAFCPDMALALAPLERTGDPEVDIVWLGRVDGEALHAAPAEVRDGADDVELVDWLEPLPGEAAWPDGARVAYQVNESLRARMRRGEPAAGRWWRAAAATFDPLARAWVARGLRIVSRGQVLVTDRLHAHVLASLADIPSVVLDNSYGKVHGVVAASTHASPLTHLAHDADEALALARSLVADRAGHPT